MSGALSEVVRLGNALLEGARSFVEAPPADPVLATGLVLAGLGALLAMRSTDAGWPPSGAAAAVPAGWAADGAMRGAAGASDGGVLKVETPGGGE